MKVTLSQAALIQRRMNDRMKEIEVGHFKIKLSVNIYDDDIYEQLKNAELEFFTAYARYVALSKAMIELRQTIDKARAENGINQYVIELAELDQLRLNLRPISDPYDTSPQIHRPTNEQINNRVKGIREINRATEYAQTSFHYLSADTISNVKQSVELIKRRIDDIQSILENINHRVEIELSSLCESTLRTENLI